MGGSHQGAGGEENINLMDEKPGTAVSRDRFAKPEGKTLADNEKGGTASQVLPVKGFTEGNDNVEDDSEEDFDIRAPGSNGEEEVTNPVMKELFRSVNTRIQEVEDGPGLNFQRKAVTETAEHTIANDGDEASEKGKAD